MLLPEKILPLTIYDLIKFQKNDINMILQCISTFDFAAEYEFTESHGENLFEKVFNCQVKINQGWVNSYTIEGSGVAKTLSFAALKQQLLEHFQKIYQLLQSTYPKLAQ